VLQPPALRRHCPLPMIPAPCTGSRRSPSGSSSGVGGGW
jgi:hypothetical protein